MLVDETNHTITFYSGTKKSIPYPMPNQLRGGTTQSALMQLGTGDVGSWTATSAKPAGAVEWG